MELRHLRYFVQVAEDLHFGRAAEHLGVSQPPLSQQIRALEHELGLRLFERTSRRVELTPAGHRFLIEAEATLARAAQAVAVARRAARGELGELVIGMNATAPCVPSVSSALHDFRTDLPEVVLTLSEGGAASLVDGVVNRRLDLALLRRACEPEVPEGLITIPILVEPLLVVMRPDHPLAKRDGLWLRDLDGQPLLVYAQSRSGGFTQELFAMMRGADCTVTVSQTAEEIMTLFGLAAAGFGVVVTAQSVCNFQQDTLVVRRLLDPQAISGMWLITRDDPSPLCCGFVRMLRERSCAALR